MAAPTHPTVLYVDDDADSRLTFRWIFQEAGFDVKEAATGSDALRLAAEKPDVVVLDVNLPDINGFEVCRRIKAHPGTSAIPVLHLTGAYVSSHDKSLALEEGADGYLIKPVEPEELIAQVKALVRIRQAEDRLRAVAQQWQATFDAISDGVCLLDRHGRVLRCNQGLSRLLDRPPGELIGRPHEELTPGAPGGPRTPFTRMLATRRREVAEVALGDRWLQGVADPMLADDGTVIGAVYILSDVTQRRRLEEQLRHAQKMEAVGRLAGGVAHDFNNLLTGILGSVSVLLAGAPAGGPQHGLLKTVESLGWRAAELVQQLLCFSRRTVVQLRHADLGAVVREVAGILERAIDPRVKLEVRPGERLWPVLADLAQLTQVLMNLCLNARDAMPDGGHLLLEAANLDLDEAGARLTGGGRPGSFVRLRVSDTGHGIPPEVLPRIFEPFFTTKPAGQGTGLGLAIAFGIVQQHQGWVDCDTAVGRGTRFDVYLPRCEPESERPGSAPASFLAPGGREGLLVVDDEPVIRDLAGDWLRRHGYRVWLAADGQEAVEVYEREPGRIDLVVMDLTMPRLSGRDALRRLRERDPKASAVFVSGFSSESLPQIGAEEGVLGFVQKPYSEHELAVAVRAALDRRPV